MAISIRNPEIVKVLDISTGHMTKNDAVLLDRSPEDEDSPAIVYKYDEGYFVYVGDFLDERHNYEDYRDYGFSDAFTDILLFAKKTGMKYVQFDCDGASYCDLPNFTW